ncbi:MAG: hypothetical protein LBC02_04090 [Planctomycetaceae bacterium]|jgi:hypothetical protein|nr:hypothetical protein [Planctomycetaceae bacterium]
MFYVFDSNRHLTENGEQQFNQQIQKTFKGEMMLSPLAERYAAVGVEKGIAIGESRGITKGKVERHSTNIASLQDAIFFYYIFLPTCPP